jgi:hypothetical protein
MNKELLVKVLKFLKEEPDTRDLTLAQIEERFYQFESFIIELVEEVLQDKETKDGTMTTWWLYENVDKKIYEEGQATHDVESAEDFVNYMTER